VIQSNQLLMIYGTAVGLIDFVAAIALFYVSGELRFHTLDRS